MGTTLKEFILLSWCTVSLVCANAFGKDRFNVNDVSFLWPAPLNSNQVDGLISLKSLIPSSIFDGIKLNYNLDLNEFSDINNWRVSSVRMPISKVPLTF